MTLMSRSARWFCSRTTAHCIHISNAWIGFGADRGVEQELCPARKAPVGFLVDDVAELVDIYRARNLETRTAHEGLGCGNWHQSRLQAFEVALRIQIGHTKTALSSTARSVSSAFTICSASSTTAVLSDSDCICCAHG